MTSSWLRVAAALAGIFAVSGALAAAEPPQRLICATVEALDCEAGAACIKGQPSAFGAPAFMRIDLDNMSIAGPHRTTPIVSLEKRADSLLLQGVEGAYGWTLVIGTRDGSMAATLLDREGAFILFGSCTAL